MNQAVKNLYDAVLKQVEYKLKKSHGKDFLSLPCDCAPCRSISHNSHHTKTSQLIFCANQLTGFYMMRTLVVKGLSQCKYFPETKTSSLCLF